jgi:hypothetical protein
MRFAGLLARLFPKRGRHHRDPDATVTLPRVAPWAGDGQADEPTRFDLRRDRPYVRRDPPDMLP